MDTSNHKERLVNSLQEILQKNYDAEEGLKHVMQKTDSPVLKKWLQQKANERSGFATEIDSELKKLGAASKASGSILGTAHRVWIDVKTALSTNRAETILEECIRGDKASVEEYNEQLKAPYMAGSVIEVLTNQKAKVERSLLTFKRLEDLVD
ncbi:PA2169 family four-helix-bundle protein [Cryomorpha ignava]|uniref:PA2169 family four-helix-bundle protein n=1 Tax=Cryomorpha ignava TaxID=101383 RepID=A0A7K3WNC1_9FLAO|nr:PA2169 family four-helix-bundle protein [Cryomorpha ignava]NEN22362.1 PA2169 family four-helix-bundle protein [Cryomorpha ignava]